MRIQAVWIAVWLGVSTGCGQAPPEPPAKESYVAPRMGTVGTGVSPRGLPPRHATFVSVIDGRARLSPTNAKIDLSASSVLRKAYAGGCGFADFDGVLGFDSTGRVLISVTLEINADSIKASDPELLERLRSAEVLDVEQNPTITFVSDSVSDDDLGRFTATGQLTLRGVSKEISLPISGEIGEAGVMLSATAVIDAMEFGVPTPAGLEDCRLFLYLSVGQRSQFAEQPPTSTELGLGDEDSESPAGSGQEKEDLAPKDQDGADAARGREDEANESPQSA